MNEIGPEEQEWAEGLDAMTAAPDHHYLLFENEHVRVLDSLLRPGEATPVHTHRWPSLLYVLSTSDFVRYRPDGEVVLDSRGSESMAEPGKAIWSPPLKPHFVRNVGDGDLRVISVELKHHQAE
jgi:quercetin dioxygenase-like cupin family protein